MQDSEKVINDLQDAVNDDWMWQHADYYAMAMENAIALLKEQETVVRCKDCKHRSKELYDYYGNPNNKVYVCQMHDLAKKPDWFCADGERRDDDD